MTERLKRGGPYPSGFAKEEAELVGPYPTWDRWKNTIKSHLGVNLKTLKNSTEAVLREGYIIRRLIQLGEVDSNTWSEFIMEVDEEHPGLLDENERIIRFIVEKTESQQVKSKAGAIRRT
jgi:hypothetical protein